MFKGNLGRLESLLGGFFVLSKLIYSYPDGSDRKFRDMDKPYFH